jgi:hypothetical protein
MTIEMRHVRVASGREIVDDSDAVTIPQKTLGKMTADEAGAAGDEYVVHRELVGHGCACTCGRHDMLKKPAAPVNAVFATYYPDEDEAGDEARMLALPLNWPPAIDVRRRRVIIAS